MIIPSIDLMKSRAVQLIGGREKALDAGPPVPILESFRLAGEVAVVDLDAAMGCGSNEELIRRLCRMAPCRVGGGIRTARAAIDWLDAGAAKIVIGTAAEPDLLKQLPRERVIVALDALNGEVMINGWKRGTGHHVYDCLKSLQEWVGGFLVTFIEREGRLQGIDLNAVEELVDAAGGVKLTVAGGVTTAQEIAALDQMGVDAQVGMALYTDRLDLGVAIAAPMQSDRTDGLWPTVVVDDCGTALGLAWSNSGSLSQAVHKKQGIYHSRSRGLWVKGQTSGDTQELLRVDLDCDRDCLRFTVRQNGNGFCHRGDYTCWANDAGIPMLARRLANRKYDAPPGSYTKRLFDEPAMLRGKLIEEAEELAAAVSADEVIAEAGDLVYFLLVALAKAGVSWSAVQQELAHRTLKVTRRPGDLKKQSE